MPIDTVFDMIKDNRSISKFLVMTYGCDMPMNLAALERLVSEHPKLTKLELLSYQLMANDAITLIRQLNLLEELRFLMPRLEYVRMVSQLKYCCEWTAEYNNVWYNQHIVRVELIRRT